MRRLIEQPNQERPYPVEMGRTSSAPHAVTGPFAQALGDQNWIPRLHVLIHLEVGLEELAMPNANLPSDPFAVFQLESIRPGSSEDSGEGRDRYR